MRMYVIVKNDKTVLNHGLTKHTWKYLDECRDAAVAETTSTDDTITVCELKPLYTYNLELTCKETELGDESNNEELDAPPNEDDAPNEDSEGDTPSEELGE